MNLLLRPHELTRSPAPRLEAGILDLAALRQRSAAWDHLCGEAAYPNPFHSRPVIEAHAAGGLLDRRLRFVAVSEGETLQALLPFVQMGSRIGLRRSHAAWLPRHFMVNGTPLVARSAPAETVHRLVEAMANAGSLWRLPLLSLECVVGRELIAACRRRGLPIEILASFDRAVLHRGQSYDSYARGRLGADRRKGLERRRRSLEARGRVEFAGFTAGEGLRRAVESFLALEAAGWKGRRGTALGAREPAAALARALFGSPEAPVSSRADVLSLDGRPIAVSLALLCGGTAFLLKTAYDEGFRRHAPGLLLEDAILRAFLDEGFAEKLDSASMHGSVLEEFFSGRERMADLVVATDPAISQAALARLVRQERAKTGRACRPKILVLAFDRPPFAIARSPSVPPLVPADLGIRLGVCRGEIGLEIEERGAVEAVEPLHGKARPIEAQELDDRERDRVRPGRGSQCEHASGDAVVPRRLQHEVPRGAVHPVEHHEVRAGLEIGEPGGIARLELDRADCLRFGAVLRALLAAAPGRADAADEVKPGIEARWELDRGLPRTDPEFSLVHACSLAARGRT
jgi:CelD/BcsL family acetyltransferase involved in cellulose biosynthesis